MAIQKNGDEAVGNFIKWYLTLSATDDPIAWYEGSSFSGTNERPLRPDWQGSIALVTDSAGGPPASNTYDEWGIPGISNTGRFQYTGQALLSELGIYYYKARMYFPTLGRFMQTDPIGYRGQSNLYAYVGNDPLNKVDPSGLCEKEKLRPKKPGVFTGDAIKVGVTSD